jgi:hypothetical protein
MKTANPGFERKLLTSGDLLCKFILEKWVFSKSSSHEEIYVLLLAFGCLPSLDG